MNFILPKSIIDASQELLTAIRRDCSDRELNKRTQKLFEQMVCFISKEYFNITDIPKANCCINFRLYDSFFDLESGKTTIALHNSLPSQIKESKLVADIIHESVHCAQKAFALSVDLDGERKSYIEALCYNSLHQKTSLNNKKESLMEEISTYVDRASTNKENMLYYSQPCEIQANTIMDKILHGLLNQNGIDSEVIDNLPYDKADYSFASLIRNRTFDHNIVSTMAKIELNIHKGSDFPIEKDAEDVYKKRLSRLFPKYCNFFDSYHISSTRPHDNKEENLLNIIDNANGLVNLTYINEQKEKLFKESLLNDIVLSTDANLEKFMLTICGHQYLAPAKDINEFLFMIGEKRFADIIHYDPEMDENYKIEELEK